MCAKFEYRNLSRYYSTNSATPPCISTNGTVNTRLLIDKPKNNQYLTKIFKTLFFKISTKSTFQTKRSFQNTSHHKPKHNFKTSFPCTSIFSPKTKTATINLIGLSKCYFTS